MPITRINYGSAPDDGTGDPLRVAFKKTDDNFVDLDTRKAEQQDVADALAMKVDKVAGKGLSTEDFTTAEKQKLDGIEEGAQVNPGPATSVADGLMSAADKAKLDGIDLATDTEDGLMSAADKAKLDGIEDGATANSTDAYLLDRANHTGTQPASTITGLSVGASFTTVPTTNQGPSIVVTEPHLRFMVWDGTRYVRAPWHRPGVLFFSHAPSANVTHGIQVRADVTYNTADHPDLAEIFGVSTPTFVLPEGRARVLRAADLGIGIDTSLVNGYLQEDAGRNLTGSVSLTVYGAGRPVDGAFGASQSGARITTGTTGQEMQYANLDASRQWPVADEFRVKSLTATLYITR